VRIEQERVGGAATAIQSIEDDLARLRAEIEAIGRSVVA
jgi:hypothetical protein